MKLKLLFSLAFIFFLFSCSDKNKLPKDILPREKMEAVLWDMLRAGEFLDSYVFNKDTAIDKVAESEKWYDKIYQLNGITKEQFKKSFAYYKDNLTALKPILDSLSKKEMEDSQPVQTQADAQSSQSQPVDTTLLNRRDSLIKLHRETKLKSQAEQPTN